MTEEKAKELIDPIYLSQEDIEHYCGNNFICPVCEQQHELHYNRKITCRCGTEFQTVLAGKEGVDSSTVQNLDHDINLREKGMAVIRVEYSIAEDWLGLVLMLGKDDIKRSEICGNSSHIRVPRSELKEEFFILNLTGG